MDSRAPDNSTQTVTVRPLQHADETGWDDFVLQHPEGSFFHLSGWQRVIDRSFGHKTFYMFAERGGRVCGVLPLGRIRSLLFGDALISTPFCVYGGIIASEPAARTVLEKAAVDLAEKLGVDYLEMRYRRPVNPDWPSKDLYWTFRKEIDPDPDVNFKAIPKKQRAMVRKGIQFGLSARACREIDDFYATYSESVRNLGTPVFSRKYFKELMETFANDCEVIVVEEPGGELIAGVVSFYFRDEVLPYYGGGTSAARDLKGNDFLYWNVMRDAAERGFRIFDYGRSKKGTGSFRFKKHWGFQPEPLSYEYHLVKARRVPDVSPHNPRYRLFIELWRRLPLPLANVLGPMLARNFG